MADVSRLHASAISGLIQAAVASLQVDGRYKVYVGEVTDPEDQVAYPYYVAWPPPATRISDTLAGYTNGSAATVTQVTAAGIAVDEVLAALDLAAEALHGKTPVIAGRRTGQIRQLPGATPPAPQRDDRVHTSDGRPVFYSFALFGLRSNAT